MNRPYADDGEVRATIHEVRATLARIEAQTTRTNGRVRSLEQFKAAAIAVGSLLILETGWVLALVNGWFH